MNKHETLAQLRYNIDNELYGMSQCKHPVEIERCKNQLTNNVERYADFLKEILSKNEELDIVHNNKLKFELELLEVLESFDGPNEKFSEVDILIAMRNDGYFKPIENTNITLKDAIKLYENIIKEE